METFPELLTRWQAAEACGDAAVLDALLAPDFHGDGPDGFVLDKATWLARRHVAEFCWTAVSVHHRVAFATGIARYRGGEFTCTVVGVRGDGCWRIVNLQLGVVSGECCPNAMPET